MINTIVKYWTYNILINEIIFIVVIIIIIEIY